MEELIGHLRGGGDLGEREVKEAAAGLLSDAVGEEMKAEFLRALAEKGERPGEIAGFVKAFLERAVDPGVRGGGSGAPLLDVCGTGGDKLDLFNVSTTTIFILAAGGIRVVKHGNRGITSKSGGADVLEALGVRIDLAPEEFAKCVEEVGVGFLFAPLYHPAFKAVAPVRKTLAAEGKRTIFNLVGPLLNPVRPDYQVVGVFAKELTGVFAEILASLGRKGAWAVHGKTDDGRGMDEMSTLGKTTICKVFEGAVAGEEEFDAAELGVGAATVEDLRGGDAVENARVLTAILEGRERGPKREIVLLNAAAGFVVTGRADDLGGGVRLAGELIDDGRAMRVLEAMRGFGG